MSIKYEVYYEFFVNDFKTPEFKLLLHSTKSQQKLKHYLELFLTNNQDKWGNLLLGIEGTVERFINLIKHGGKSHLWLTDVSGIESKHPNLPYQHFLSVYSKDATTDGNINE